MTSTALPSEHSHLQIETNHQPRTPGGVPVGPRSSGPFREFPSVCKYLKTVAVDEPIVNVDRRTRWMVHRITDLEKLLQAPYGEVVAGRRHGQKSL